MGNKEISVLAERGGGVYFSSMEGQYGILRFQSHTYPAIF